MKVAVYARESSDDKTRSPPIEDQVKRGQEWAVTNNHEVMQVYTDDGYSGGDWLRPAWHQCVKDAKRHHYQILWVWNQDRIARDTEQFLWFYRMLSESKAKIWEDTSNSFINMDDLGGRVKHQTLAQAAEIFRLVTSDKVKQAYRRKKAKGERWGRKALTFDKKRAVMLRNEGKGWRDIARILLTEGLVKSKPNKEPRLSYQTVRRYIIGLNSKGVKGDGLPSQSSEGYSVTKR